MVDASRRLRRGPKRRESIRDDARVAISGGVYFPQPETGARVPTLGVSALASLLRGGSVGQIAVVAAGADVGSGDRHVGRGIGVGDGEGGWCVGGCPRHWEDAINIAERKDEVANAIAELPERLRLIVTLYDYEHLTQHEIAQRLGVESAPRVSTTFGSDQPTS